MGTLHEFSGAARPRGAAVMHPAVAGRPLMLCSSGPAPDWSIARLGEDRFRLTLAAAGLADDDVTVDLEGGLLRIDGQRRGDLAERAAVVLRCMFLLLEPLRLVGWRLLDGRLLVDLQRDTATPCRAKIPPRRYDTAALALAA